MPSPRPYRKKDGTVTWSVRFRLPDRQTSERFDTRREADAFCRDLDELGPIEAVKIRDEQFTGRGQVTLDEVAVAFFDWKTPRVRSDRTIADYRRDYRNWIQPTFGRRRVVGITETDVQRWVDAMHTGKLGKAASPKSVGDRHALLHSILGHAVRDRIIDLNPAVGTDMPKRRKGMPKGLRPLEWSALHTAMRTINQDYADAAEALLATGWRFSEIAGMAVYQVEDTGDALFVSMEQVMRRNAAGQHVIVEEGKSEASLRRIAVDAKAAAMFRRRVIGKGPSDPVFTTSDGARLHHSNFMRDGWNPAVKAAGLARRPTPHWLRHTHVFWMALTGTTLPELQSRIGHESITTTIGVYGRMLTDVTPEALNAFAAMRDGDGPKSGLIQSAIRETGTPEWATVEEEEPPRADEAPGA